MLTLRRTRECQGWGRALEIFSNLSFRFALSSSQHTSQQDLLHVNFKHAHMNSNWYVCSFAYLSASSIRSWWQVVAPILPRAFTASVVIDSRRQTAGWSSYASSFWQHDLLLRSWLTIQQAWPCWHSSSLPLAEQRVKCLFVMESASMNCAALLWLKVYLTAAPTLHSLHDEQQYVLSNTDSPWRINIGSITWKRTYLPFLNFSPRMLVR